jgi:PAS domain S-box-containing protein
VVVLHATNDRAAAELIRAHLERSNLHVELAGTAEDCLQRLVADRFDVLLLDHHLDALDLLARIRRDGSSIPVLYLTPERDDDLVVRALEAGATDYVQKADGYIATLPLRLRASIMRVRSAAMHELIVNGTDQGVWMIDAMAQTSFVNPKMALMLGYTAAEMQGRPLLDFMDEDARELATRNLARRRQGIAEPHEFAFRRKDGSPLDVMLTANPVMELGRYMGAFALISEIGERKRAEARFRSLFEHSPNCLWEEDCSAVKVYFEQLRAEGVTDIRAHFRDHPEEMVLVAAKVKVLDVNQAAIRHYGARDKAELIAGMGRILAPESLPVLTEQMISLAEGRTVFESEAMDQSLGGRKNNILLKVLVAPGCESTLSTVYVSIIDITAHKLLEEQLRQSQKMDAIGQLASGIAHDFNNLLTVIHVNTALMRSDRSTAALKGDALQGISAATDRAADLIRQLLTFSRKTVIRPREVDINIVVASLAKMIERVLREDVHLRLDLTPGPLLTRGDPGMLEQLLMNLVVNARDAMPDGGNLAISTSEVMITDDDLVRMPALRPGPHVCVRVVDTGHGIPAQNLDRIFEPFFTTKQPGEGTGLGLAIVFGIVQQHGGALSVRSEVGRGSTFAWYLPASEGGGVPYAARVTETVVQGGAESLLLVEDEENVRVLVRQLLEHHGYRVEVARTGSEALELVRANPGFDLVLTDMIMPGGVSGRDLAERLRADRPDLKIIWMSGHDGEIAGRGIELREGVNFLQKPFGQIPLLACVRRCLDD